MQSNPTHAHHERKRKADFPGMENAAVVITVLFLLFFAVIRLENSVYLQNRARANKELHQIYQLQQDHLQKTGKYTDDIEVLGFQPRYPYTGILYSIKLDTASFTAYAAEVAGNDPFGDRRDGNEYLSIGPSGSIQQGTFSLD